MHLIITEPVKSVETLSHFSGFSSFFLYYLRHQYYKGKCMDLCSKQKVLIKTQVLSDLNAIEMVFGMIWTKWRKNCWQVFSTSGNSVMARSFQRISCFYTATKSSILALQPTLIPISFLFSLFYSLIFTDCLVWNDRTIYLGWHFSMTCQSSNPNSKMQVPTFDKPKL